ncbi:Thioredoxin domain-containing protein 9 homolog [Linum perenne]
MAFCMFSVEEVENVKSFKAVSEDLGFDLLCVMDKHLAVLAKQHIETRFVKINAEKSPFLADKLKIVVLPTLALIKNAKVDDYVVGFDQLGGTDDFSTEELEERLAKAKVIFYEDESSVPKSSNQTKRNVRQSETHDSSDSE